MLTIFIMHLILNYTNEKMFQLNALKTIKKISDICEIQEIQISVRYRKYQFIKEVVYNNNFR